jgi:hypothetical protein
MLREAGECTMSEVKQWVVLEQTWDGPMFRGVFSTKTRAQAYITGREGACTLDIMEWTLDEGVS